ncbi:hypothetical protein GGR54DRAFT_377625 [Hypoxylon sp. NC1633]|nr:hypothetical protein GGR54DRAFT_377625 [Hypoxylon sp. NC1633]
MFDAEAQPQGFEPPLLNPIAVSFIPKRNLMSGYVDGPSELSGGLKNQPDIPWPYKTACQSSFQYLSDDVFLEQFSSIDTASHHHEGAASKLPVSVPGYTAGGTSALNPRAPEFRMPLIPFHSVQAASVTSAAEIMPDNSSQKTPVINPLPVVPKKSKEQMQTQTPARAPSGSTMPELTSRNLPNMSHEPMYKESTPPTNAWMRGPPASLMNPTLARLGTVSRSQTTAQSQRARGSSTKSVGTQQGQSKRVKKKQKKEERGKEKNASKSHRQKGVAQRGAQGRLSSRVQL